MGTILSSGQRLRHVVINAILIKKIMRKYILLLLCAFFSVSTLCQEKEILIIGTMHEVPGMVKNSYKPLLKFAKKYHPEAIYVEYIQPCDTLSLNFYTPKFVKQSDSLKNVWILNEERFEKLQKLQLTELNKDDFDFLAKTYLILRDRANYQYYNYLKKYGLAGCKKPLRNENTDLTFKLAGAMQIKQLYSMDDHHSTDKYYKAWHKNIQKGANNGDNDSMNKLSKKDYNQSVIPSLLGNLGKYTNKPQSLNRKHIINSGRYVANPSPESDAVATYWNARNCRMAKNIAERVNTSPFQRNIVIVGAGHVIGIKEALAKNYPGLKVKLMFK